jgi:hypothetical protein
MSVETAMTILSQADPTAEITCTLPVNEAGGRLNDWEGLIGGSLDHLSRDGNRLRMRILRGGRVGLETEVAAFAEAEKACCAFLGFEVESAPDAVTLEIVAPVGAEPTLEGIEWMLRAAGRQDVA